MRSSARPQVDDGAAEVGRYRHHRIWGEFPYDEGSSRVKGGADLEPYWVGTSALLTKTDYGNSGSQALLRDVA